MKTNIYIKNNSLKIITETKTKKVVFDNCDFNFYYYDKYKNNFCKNNKEDFKLECNYIKNYLFSLKDYINKNFWKHSIKFFIQKNENFIKVDTIYNDLSCEYEFDTRNDRINYSFYILENNKRTYKKEETIFWYIFLITKEFVDFLSKEK